MTVCPFCQQPVGPNAEPVCPSCGKTLEDSPAPTQLVSAYQNPSAPTLAEEVQRLWGETLHPNAPGTVSLRRLPRVSQMRSPETVHARSLAEGGDATADYLLLEVLGEGGMGVVRSAWQTALERTIAVKLIRPHAAGNEQARAKFLSEALVTGDLDHPNIVPIFDLGRTADGTLFYAMKRVQGVPWIQMLPGKSEGENLEVLLRVCDAVAFAHSRGVIHRDLKPSNVMLGDFGEVLVMDWGLAASVTPDGKAERLAQAGGGGTPAYMAPEMALRDFTRIGFASDVYLLGAILYEILTGRPPHSGLSALVCLFAASENRIEPPPQSSELADVAMKALATRPEDRFGSVKDFQAAIRVCLAHSQSVALSASAEGDLCRAGGSGDYDDYARAVFGFEEALNLWQGNHAAQRGVTRARREYAARAQQRGDLDLAASLLVKDDPEHARLAEQIALARWERDTRQRRLKLLGRTAASLLALVLVTLTVAFFWIRASRDRAVEAENDAREQEASAIEARDEARYEAYVARVGLAAQLIERSSFEQAVALLEDCPQELRHWEWGRLWFQCHRAEMVMQRKGTGARVSALAMSPDGRRLAVGYTGHTSCYLHDTRTGREVLEVKTGPVWVGAFSFSPDGRRLLAVTTAGTYVWDTGTGKKLLTLAHLGQAGTYSGDGRHILTGGQDDVARLWDAQTGMELRAFVGHTKRVTSLSLSPDNRILCTGSHDGTARLWNVDTGETIHILRGPPPYVQCVGFSPNGDRVFTGGPDRTVWLWEVASGKRVIFTSKLANPFIPHGHNQRILSGAYSSSGQFLCTGSSDNTARVWDGRRIIAERQVLRGHSGWVSAVAFSPDEKRVWTGSEDGSVRAWSLEDGDRDRWEGNWGGVGSVAFLPDGKTALVGGIDDVVRLRDVVSGKPGTSLRVFAHERSVHGVSFSPDGKRLVTCGADHTLRIWDRETGTELVTLDGLEGSPEANFSPDGTKVIAATADGLVRLWNSADGKELHRFKPHDGERVASVVFSPNGKLVLTCGDDGTVRLWDAGSFQKVHILKGHDKRVNHGVFSPDGNRVLTSSEDGTARVWETATGQVVHVLEGHRANVQMGAFSRDNGRVLTAGWDGTARMWDARTGRELQVFRGHTGPLLGVAFSPDGKQVATAGDTTVRLWDASSGQPLFVLPSFTVAARDVSFTPDGKELVTAGDQSIQFWPVASIREDWREPNLPGPGVRVVASPDGRYVVSGDRTGIVRLRDAKTLRPLRHFARLKERVRSLAVSPDSRMVAAGSTNLVYLFEADTGKLLWSVANGDFAVTSIAFSPDGQHLLTTSNDTYARIRAVANGKEQVTFRGHSWWVYAGVYSPDGKRVVTVGDDRVARVWDPHTGKELAVLQGHASGLRAVVFSPDGRRIVTAGQDGTIKVWDARTAKELVSLAGSPRAVTCLAFSPDGRNLLFGGDEYYAYLWPSASWE